MLPQGLSFVNHLFPGHSTLERMYNRNIQYSNTYKLYRALCRLCGDRAAFHIVFDMKWDCTHPCRYLKVIGSLTDSAYSVFAQKFLEMGKSEIVTFDAIRKIIRNI